MRRVFDSSGNQIFSSTGDEVLHAGLSRKYQYTDETETALRRYRETNRSRMDAVDAFLQYLKYNGLYSNISNFWHIPPTRSEDYGKQLIGNNGLQSSGDHTWSLSGINGGGSYYFNTKVNPSTDISDINNFAFGVYNQDNTNTGYDLGCLDGVNNFFFGARYSGNTIVAIGTSSDVFSCPDNDSTGSWIVSVRDGTIYVYKNGSEYGGGSSVVGGLPNYQMYLGGVNASGSPTSYTSRTYSNVWIYNASHTEAEILGIDRQVQNLQSKFLRGYEFT